ncbi:hypothetical protein WA158_002582 [Blastocystis sp. Blastoise]
MSENKSILTEDKYLFTFQDETQLWISRELLEKYPQFPFHDIIQHSDKYEDGSYYIDIPSMSMDKVISLFNDKNIDISSLNLRDSYDIYRTLFEYSVTLDKEIQSDLLFHVEELFIDYLKANHYAIYGNKKKKHQLTIPMEVFNSETKILFINGLITSLQMELLFYYSLLIKMMNIKQVDINYEYASNIPLEYICPSCIKDIYPSLRKLTISETIHYNKSDELLNPNTEEYLKEYTVFCNKYGYEMKNNETYEYYMKSEMKRYNEVSPFNKTVAESQNYELDSYFERVKMNALPKLYKCNIDETLYVNDFSQIERSQNNDSYILMNKIGIEYDIKTGSETLYIYELNSEYGITQLLSVPLYSSISEINISGYKSIQKRFTIPIVNAFENGVFDSIKTINALWFLEMLEDNKWIQKHIFPNVTKFIYDDRDKFMSMSLVNKERFPGLHIIHYGVNFDESDLQNLFPGRFISMIDTIILNDYDERLESVTPFLDDLAFNHSIHIDGLYDNINDLSHREELLEKNIISLPDDLEVNACEEYYYDSLLKYYKYAENQKLKTFNIIFLYIWRRDDDYDIEYRERNGLDKFEEITSDNEEITSDYEEYEEVHDTPIGDDMEDDLELLFESSSLDHLDSFSFELKQIGSESSSEYFSMIQDILKKIIPKSSDVSLNGIPHYNIIEGLIENGYFHNTAQLKLELRNFSISSFFELYTKNNFPQLKNIDISCSKISFEPFMETLCLCLRKDSFLSSTTVSLNDNICYNPSYSILQCKYSLMTPMESIIIDNNEDVSKYQIAILLDCIKENKVQDLKSLKIYFYETELLTKIIDIVTTQKIPKLKEFLFICNFNISEQLINTCKQQLKDSPFIQNNHLRYKLLKL